MFGFREVREVKKYEKNLYQGFDPDKRIILPGRDRDELITTDEDNDKPWSPDTRVEWLID